MVHSEKARTFVGRSRRPVRVIPPDISRIVDRLEQAGLRVVRCREEGHGMVFERSECVLAWSSAGPAGPWTVTLWDGPTVSWVPIDD